MGMRGEGLKTSKTVNHGIFTTFYDLLLKLQLFNNPPPLDLHRTGPTTDQRTHTRGLNDNLFNARNLYTLTGILRHIRTFSS